MVATLANCFTCLQSAWVYSLILGLPSLAILIKFEVIAFKFLLNSTVKSFIHKLVLCAMASLFSFYWAVTFTTIRLSDDLTTGWQQKYREIISVVASLPEVVERGERFRFDVKKIITAQVNVPQHV